MMTSIIHEAALDNVSSVSNHIQEPSFLNHEPEQSTSNQGSETASPLDQMDNGQRSFCIGIQTDISQINSVFIPTSGLSNLPDSIPISLSQGTAETTSPRNLWQRIRGHLNKTTLCYLVMAAFTIVVGTIVVAFAEFRQGNTQLWIVGPAFILTGLLILVKASTRLCRGPVLTSVASFHEGNILTPDSRASLRTAIPPSYSRALAAPVPSFVKVIEDDTDDKESEQNIEPNEHRLVTFMCDPPPPTYVEAIE